jgi:tRNA pseudouridine32 synthase/23S rRNA pseudouridine746 synthase
MTSGLLILAKNIESNQVLSKMFEQRNVTKYYLALSNQKPKKKQGLIKGDMAKSRGGSWKLLKSKGNPAVTQFFSFSISLSAQNPVKGLRLFLLKPRTGKTHQLRVALKSLGAPILGDERYFPKAEKGKSEVLSSSNTADSIWHVDRGYLHAWRLIFVYQGETFDISDLPQSGRLFCDEGMTRFLSDLGHPNELDWPLV